ncbi:MAG: family 43 glycosylhydrolase [Motilibacteraceae bacterium]
MDHASAHQSSPGRSLLVPGADWRDTDGNLIEAHTGGLFSEDATYYWVGARWQGTAKFCSFELYSSANLQDWTFRSTLLRPSVELPAEHEIARPKILYNDVTGTYVMWFKRKDYAAAVNDVRAGVAVSASLEGPWTFHRDFYPGEGGDLEFNTADFCLWQEPGGEAYLVASSPSLRGGAYGRRIVIFRLTPDFRGVEPEPVYVGPVDEREAPAVFVRAGTYYLVTSGTTGWAANQCAYRTAPSIRGPWSQLRTLGDATTYGTQPDFVFPVHGDEETTYVYAGGRHVGEDLAASRYVWLPLTFSGEDGEQLALEPLAQWSLDVRTGRWRPGV